MKSDNLCQHETYKRLHDGSSKTLTVDIFNSRHCTVSVGQNKKLQQFIILVGNDNFIRGILTTCEVVLIKKENNKITVR